MRVVVVALAKNEHLYINEWVKHYVNLGVDKIYIYDNDDKTSPFIGGFINKKYASKVEIKDIRGMRDKCFQHTIYTGFYNKYKNTFDYCLFCDIDEFLVGVDNIKTWLSKIKAYQIRIKWRLFGDDNVIKRDTRIPLMDFFKEEVKETLTNDLKRKNTLENQGKFILRGGMPSVYINSCHFGCLDKIGEKLIPSVLPSGKPCKSRTVINEDYSEETIYLNHYMTKTLDEFINQKLNRNDAVFNKALKLNYFWRVNKKTPEKEKYLKDMGLE